MTPPTDQPLNLDQIEAVIVAATPGPWGVYEYGGDSLIEIAADLEDTGTGYRARRTVCRLDEEPLDNDPTHRDWTAEEDWAQVQADAAYIAAMSPESAKAVAAEIRRLRDRVAELERPAVEAKRNEIRDSYAQSIAMAREDRDYEGAFNVECQLREREEQWKTEDAAAQPAAVQPPLRGLTASEYNSAWHAVEGAAGEEGADPGTVLHAVLDRLGIDWQDAAALPAAARP